MYKFVDKPPKWIEDEPSWPYLDDKPMVFLTQYKIPKNKFTLENIGTDGNVAYLFAGKRCIKKYDGFEVIYTVVE